MIKFGEKYKNDDILPYILKICDSTNNILKIIGRVLKLKISNIFNNYESIY